MKEERKRALHGFIVKPNSFSFKVITVTLPTDDTTVLFSISYQTENDDTHAIILLYNPFSYSSNLVLLLT